MSLIAQPVVFLGAAPSVQWRVAYGLETKYSPAVPSLLTVIPTAASLKKNVDEGKE